MVTLYVIKCQFVLEKTGVLEESRAQYRFIDLKLKDDLSVTSAEFLKGMSNINSIISFYLLLTIIILPLILHFQTMNT